MPNTTNHNVPLPTVGASADTWGGENNNAHQAWDTLTSGAQNTILGRVASGSGPMTQLTSAQATSALTAVVGDSGLGGTKGVVPAPAAGDAAAGKVLTAAGTWGFSSGRAIGRFNGPAGTAVVARGVSLSRTGVGAYNVTLSPAMADTNYIIQMIPESTGTGEAVGFRITSKTASSFTMETFVLGATPYDPPFFAIVILTV